MGRVDRREDRQRVLGQPAPGRGQAYPPADGFDERRARLGGQGGDLLRHGRRGHAQLVGDGAHRPEPGQLEQEAQAAGLHRAIVQDAEHFVHDSHVDVDGRHSVQWSGDRSPSRSGATLGRRLDGVRPARAGRVGRPLRPHRAGGRRVAASRVGRRSPAGARAPASVRVLPPRAGHVRRARDRDGRADVVLHGRGRAAAPGHGERAGVPRSARASPWSAAAEGGGSGRRWPPWGSSC